VYDTGFKVLPMKIRLYLKKSYLAILNLGYIYDVVSDGKLAMKINYPV
jgi:hypothetical protein